MGADVSSFDLQAARSLAAAGVRFYVSVDTVWGGKDIDCTAEELAQYLADRPAFAAQHFGVSRGDYLAWLDAEGYARCGGTVTSGRRCKHLVSGPGQLKAREWLERDGQLCTVHGGETADEARR
jgi:hypothetical protein